MEFKHKKKYGQNFLNNKDEILNKIIEVSNINENDEILEIGPGQGALTSLLVERVKKVICVEIDKDLENTLRKKFSSKENYTLVMGDVLEVDLRGKHVLIVEDIIDTGLTLEHVIKYFKEGKGVKSLRTCTLLNKPERRKVDVKVDYIGFDVPDKFVIGYGLDYDQRYRNLPYIAVVIPE